MATACDIPTLASEEGFAQVKEAMGTDKYWINFFVRPCCPPPSFEQAKKALEKRREEIRNRSDFSEAEKQELLDIVDQREIWYENSSFRRG